MLDDEKRKAASALDLPPLLEQCLQLREGLEILRPAGRTLDADQPLEVEAAALHPKELERDRVRRQGIVAASAGQLTEQVEVAKIGRQGEVELAVDSGLVPPEGQTPRC